MKSGEMGKKGKMGFREVGLFKGIIRVVKNADDLEEDKRIDLNEFMQPQAYKVEFFTSWKSLEGKGKYPFIFVLYSIFHTITLTWLSLSWLTLRFAFIFYVVSNCSLKIEMENRTLISKSSWVTKGSTTETIISKKQLTQIFSDLSSWMQCCQVSELICMLVCCFWWCIIPVYRSIYSRYQDNGCRFTFGRFDWSNKDRFGG